MIIGPLERLDFLLELEGLGNKPFDFLGPVLVGVGYMLFDGH
jgi:hypothetical protein